MRSFTLWLCSLALLAGCAEQAPQTISGPADPALWRVHQQQLAKLDGWQISGKMGIRAPQDSGSGTLFWLQRQDYYDIRLAGPLGRGAARLTGHPGRIELEIAGQGRYQADNPEQLLEAQLGWRLPVSNLPWWIRGLPAPKQTAQLQLDSQGRLARLSQAGWQLEYLSYRNEQGFELPERLKLTGHDLAITLVIKDWQPRQLGKP